MNFIDIKHPVIAIMISLAVILISTFIVTSVQYHGITLQTLINAQKSTPLLWILDVIPLMVIILRRYQRREKKYVFKKETLMVDPTDREKTDAKALIDKSMREISQDPLTGLPNRVLLRDLISYAIKIADRDKGKLSVFVLDINRFKEINNTLGHLNGDLLLKAVAKRLTGILRKSDILARFGGDEFAMLLPEIRQDDDLRIISKKIKKAFQPTFVLEGITLDVNASIGASVYPDHGEDADTLLKRADIAMSLAKEQNEHFVIYSPEKDHYSSYQLSLTGELKSAIDENDLTLYYQPKIDVKKRKVAGAEALIRWNHKEHGMILPDEFVNVAERTGLINPLFQWVAKNASQKAMEWKASGLDISMSINLSASNLLDPKLINLISELPALYDVSPEKIIFEITETAIMSDPNLSLSIISEISKMGFRFSIDDFGTGYSSFAYLARLPISEIKIDKSFVQEMLTNETNYIIVYTAIEMAHNLGLQVVAEGVESEAILSELALMGCDIAQGYLIEKPLSPEEFDAWVTTSKWGKHRKKK